MTVKIKRVFPNGTANNLSVVVKVKRYIKTAVRTAVKVDTDRVGSAKCDRVWSYRKENRRVRSLHKMRVE